MLATLMWVSDSLTSVMTLATFWEAFVDQNGVYENRRKFGELGKKVREKWRPGEHIDKWY